MFSRNDLDHLTQVFESPVLGINVCAIKCLTHEQCLTFSFEEENGRCTGYQNQMYQGNKSAAVYTQEDSLYFLNLCKYKSI